MTTPTNGFSYQIRDDGIIVYHFQDARRATIDAWLAVSVQHDAEAIAQGKHSGRLYVVSPTALPTPYSLARLTEADNQATSSGLRESTAILVQNKLMYQLLATFAKRLPKRAQSTIRFFYDEEEAVAWLLENMKNNP